MKLIFLAALLFLLVSLAYAKSNIDPIRAIDDIWTEFKQIYNKFYSNNDEEEIRRMIFESNVQKIRQHNREISQGLHNFTLAINNFADLTKQEFLNSHNGYTSKTLFRESMAIISTANTASTSLITSTPFNFSVSIDWRTQGYVTPIKDQGLCGSCWAFSAIASLEGQNFKKTGNLISLSEQNLIDCSDNFGNNGCNGGNMYAAFNYIIANKGINSEIFYSSIKENQSCKFNFYNIAATIKEYKEILSENELALTEAIANIGPISVAIDASQDSFQFYDSGIYDEPLCSSTNLDHAVTVVGYGTDLFGVDYYIVKNSWSIDWGGKQNYI